MYHDTHVTHQAHIRDVGCFAGKYAFSLVPFSLEISMSIKKDIIIEVPYVMACLK